MLDTAASPLPLKEAGNVTNNTKYNYNYSTLLLYTTNIEYY